MTYEQYLEEYSKTDDLEQCPVCFRYSTEYGICEDCQEIEDECTIDDCDGWCKECKFNTK